MKFKVNKNENLFQKSQKMLINKALLE